MCISQNMYLNKFDSFSWVQLRKYNLRKFLIIILPII